MVNSPELPFTELILNVCLLINYSPHSDDVKELGGLVLSAGRGTGLIKYEISIPPSNSGVQVQQLDWSRPMPELVSIYDWQPLIVIPRAGHTGTDVPLLGIITPEPIRITSPQNRDHTRIGLDHPRLYRDHPRIYKDHSWIQWTLNMESPTPIGCPHWPDPAGLKHQRKIAGLHGNIDEVSPSSFHRLALALVSSAAVQMPIKWHSPSGKTKWTLCVMV